MKLTPTTTLAALKANNTSAADAWPGFPQIDVPKPGNVSKVPLPFPFEKTGVHRCDWWGGSAHPNIGVKSTDPAYIKRTVTDMKERGIGWVVLDWYGEGSSEDKSALLMRDECAKQGLKLCICVDKGVKQLVGVPIGTDATAAMLKVLAYIDKTYYAAPCYQFHSDGRPLLLFFGTGGYKIDFTKLKANDARKSALIFREASGFDLPHSDGAFAWTTSSNDAFYQKGITSKKIIVAALNVGFDNTDRSLINWGSPHKIDRRNGQRWLDQIALGVKYAKSTHYWQITTWNDNQEGSAVESGITAIDNPNALHHLEYYASLDGENLMPITQEQLSELDPGSYKVFARQVMQNSMQNVMSQAVDYVVATPIPPKPVAKIEVSVPATLTALCPIGASSETPVDHWEIWIDGAKVRTSSEQKFSEDLPIKSGVHRVVVQAITKDGQTVKEVRSVNVA